MGNSRKFEITVEALKDLLSINGTIESISLARLTTEGIVEIIYVATDRGNG